MEDTEPFIRPVQRGECSSDSRTPEDETYVDKIKMTHPSHIVQRLIALLLMCLIGFGSVFCYDNPGALQDNFIKDMALSTSQFVLLYSWYSWPNVVCCFIGGFLLDRVFGIRFGTCLYCLFVVFGQLVFAFGAYTNSLLIAIMGRFIFGLGGESLAVAQNNYAVIWFKGKELNMVFGFQLSLARVGSTVNFMFMEPLYKYVSKYYHGYQCLGIVLFLACGACIMSLICAVLLAWLDKRAENMLNRRDSQSEKVVKISDVKKFPHSFWLITVIIMFYYTAIFCFVALGKVFFERKFMFEPNDANWINSLQFVFAVFLCPFLGLLIDRVGRNIFFVFVSVVFTITGHMLLAFTFLNPYIGMVLVAISYSMVGSALWPLIALVIDEHQLGTAYGLAQSFQNAGLAVFSILCGVIVDFYGYLMLETFFIACLCTSLITVVILWIYDSTHSRILNMSAEQRLAFMHDKFASEIMERERLMVANASPEDLIQRDLDSHQSGTNPDDTSYEKRPQFGGRILKPEEDVFSHNAWDNVEWDSEQEEQALKITSEQYRNKMPEGEAQEIEQNANKYWDIFYKIHKIGFFKDRHWLFTEFPELSSHMRKIFPERFKECNNSRTNSSETRLIFEIGCGVGNTVFPILQYNADPNLFVYCCDFSEEAIRMLKENPDYCSTKCNAFVNDVTAENWHAPFLKGSIDIIIMIYVLSAINPNKMQNVISKVFDYLKPGGLILFRDYGRYDMSQLRFKKGHCISENFYARGERTLVHFFTKDEVRTLFSDCGFEEIQNICDKRLQVNRKRKIKMYRVWIQAKYKKPFGVGLQ